MSADVNLFPTITGAHWREAVAMGRAKRTRRLARLKAAMAAQKLSAAGGGTVDFFPGLRIAAGQPPLARGVVDLPSAASPNRWSSARGIAECGSREASREGGAAGGLACEKISTAGPLIECDAESQVPMCELMGVAVDNLSAAGSGPGAGRAESTAEAGGGKSFALRAPNGDARSSQAEVGAAGSSCAVSSATAGRDRQFF